MAAAIEGGNEIKPVKAMSNCHINDLNEYCVIHIMRFLNIQERIRFGMTSEHFHDIFKAWPLHLYKSISLAPFGPMDDTEISTFFNAFGSEITCVAGKIPCTTTTYLYDTVALKCPNIVELNICLNMVKKKDFKLLILSMPNLELLAFRDCFINGAWIKSLKPLKRLKTLLLYGAIEVQGRYLKILPQTIETLSIKTPFLFRNRGFVSMLRRLKNLREFYLDTQTRYNAQTLQAMVKHCRKLETLKITLRNNTDYDFIAYLPNLKNLAIYCPYEDATQLWLYDKLIALEKELEFIHIVGENCVNNNVAKKLGKLKDLKSLIISYNDDLTDMGLDMMHDMNNLEEFVIQSCTAITDKGVAKFILSCPKLIRATIRDCDNVTDNVISLLIKGLRDQKAAKELLREEKLIIKLDDICFDKNYVKNLVQTEGSDLIKLLLNDEGLEFANLDVTFRENMVDYFNEYSNSFLIVP